MYPRCQERWQTQIKMLNWCQLQQWRMNMKPKEKSKIADALISDRVAFFWLDIDKSWLVIWAANLVEILYLPSDFMSSISICKTTWCIRQSVNQLNLSYIWPIKGVTTFPTLDAPKKNHLKCTEKWPLQRSLSSELFFKLCVNIKSRRQGDEF